MPKKSVSLGFSLGGQTSLAMVTGIGSASHPADRRIKAAFMGAGSNWGLLLDSADYANANVPLLFFGNDTGIVYNSFNQFTGSHPKYLVDIADYNHHIGGYESSWCQDFHNFMVEVNPDVPYFVVVGRRILIRRLIPQISPTGYSPRPSISLILELDSRVFMIIANPAFSTTSATNNWLLSCSVIHKYWLSKLN